MLNIKSMGMIFFLLLFIFFLSSYQLVLQTYEYRSAFAELEKLQIQKQELSSKTNILMEEVKFINNQISLRKYATESLGMIMPNDQRIYLPRGNR